MIYIAGGCQVQDVEKAFDFSKSPRTIKVTPNLVRAKGALWFLYFL